MLYSIQKHTKQTQLTHKQSPSGAVVTGKNEDLTFYCSILHSQSSTYELSMCEKLDDLNNDHHFHAFTSNDNTNI